MISSVSRCIRDCNSSSGSPDQALAAPIREEARNRAAERIAGLGSLAGLADKTAARTKQVTQSAVAASKTGFARAARISRENVLPELSRTGATIREHARPERLAQHYREFLLWLHASVLDSGIERLFFRPTKGHVALTGLTVRGDNRAAGHDYRPTPHFVFKWALSAIEKEDIPKLSFVDYGAGKGRVMLLAAQHPFTAVGGIEFAEELHDDATMNIAQFPRSRMKCRNVECALDDAVNIGTVDGDAHHLPHLALPQHADDPRPQDEREQQRGDRRSRRAKRDVVEEIEENVLAGERGEQVIEHVETAPSSEVA